MYRKLLLLVIGMTITIMAAGCGGYKSTTNALPQYQTKDQAVGKTSLTVLSPKDGDVITGSEVALKFKLENFKMVDFKDNPTPKAGEGHLHVWIDTDSNDPKLAAKVIKEGDFNLKDLKPGEHTLVVSTNQSDHMPTDPPNKVTIKFKTQ